MELTRKILALALYAAWAPGIALSQCIVTQPCSTVGATCSKTERNENASITFTYVCSPCRKWFPRFTAGEKFGDLCGSRQLVATVNDESAAPAVWPSGECYTPSSSSKTESWSAAAESKVECGSSGGSVLHTLPCTILHNQSETAWRTGYSWTNQGPKIPPGGQSGYQQSKSITQSIKDTGCPSPGRSVESRCETRGDALGLSCN